VRLNLKDWQPESEFLRALDARQEAAIEARGKEIGVQEMLVGMLKRRFGPLPSEVVQRVENARRDELNVWTMALLDAKSLAEVLQPAPHTNGSVA
jgi:hypothetical protein